MYEILSALERSAVGVFMRDAGLWVYPVVNLIHILGIGALFGAALIVDLRLLGLWRHVSLAAIASAGVPIATAGLCVALVTGPALLAAQATEYAGNPFLLIKFAAIAAGLFNAAAVMRLAAWRERGLREGSRHEQRRLAIAGGISLLCWLTAIAAGRFIAYW